MEKDDKNVTNEETVEVESDENVTDMESTDEESNNNVEVIEKTEEINDSLDSTTADQVAQAVFDGKPEPSQHVIDDLQQTMEMPDLDAAGTPFDENAHMVDNNGKGMKFIKGARKGQWKPKTGSQRLNKTSDKYHAAQNKQNTAGLVVSGMFSNCCLITGQYLDDLEIWTLKQEERLMMDNAFVDYFDAKEMKDLPPGVALVSAMSIVILPRLMQPKAKSKLSTVASGISLKWKEWRSKRAKQKEKKAKESPLSSTFEASTKRAE